MVRKVKVMMAAGTTKIEFFDQSDVAVFGYKIDEGGDFEKKCWSISGFDENKLTNQQVIVSGTNNHIQVDPSPIGYAWNAIIETFGDMNVSSGTFQLSVMFRNNCPDEE